MTREQKSERTWVTAAGAVAGVAALAIAAAAVWLGPLNQDEGWYLYAALETAAGRLPYRDFFFTQGPMLPLVYGWLAPLWSGAGVLGGRIVTAGFGLCAAALVAVLAARGAAPRGRLAAGVTAFALTACGIYHGYFMAIPKTYALAALLLALGLLMLTRCGRGVRAGLLWAAGSGMLLAAAAGTRISLGASLAAAGVWLLAQRRRLGFAWIAFGIGGVIGLALVYGPFVIAAPEGFRFAQTFHLGRAGGGALFVAGSMARLLRGYLPLAGVAVVAAAWRLFRCPQQDAQKHETNAVPWPSLWLTVAVTVVAVHLTSPYPYDDYQVPVMPLLAAAAAVWLMDAVGRSAAPAAARAAAVWAVLTCCGLAAAASPLVQEWFVIRQDRFWVVQKDAPDLAVLRRVGASLKRPETRETAPLLLTQDVYLAVESGRRVPSGLEMGPFGYFPGMDTDQARRLLVLNSARLLQVIETTEAPDAAISGYAFAISAPAMNELDAADQRALRQTLAQRYDRVGEVRDFGQGWTTLQVWELKAHGDHRAGEKDAGPTDPESRDRGRDRPPAL